MQEKAVIEAEFKQHCPPATSIDHLETIYTVPPQLGSGYSRTIELYPGLELFIFNRTFRNLTVSVPENRHPLQFMVALSGVCDSGDFVLIDPEHSYVGGSGIQRSYRVFHPHLAPQIGVDIHLQPHLLQQFFATPAEELPAELQSLVQGENWQRVFSPKTTVAMRSVVQQIIGCPFLGPAKQLYLQGKVLELMALQLNGVGCISEASSPPSLKPDTTARIHYAADILRSRLEDPPCQTELAQQVGLSDRTLRRGFQALFCTTVWGYLTEQRLLQAEHLLRHGNLTVAEVVYRSGYSNQGHFAAAFKRKFGMTPKQCARGKQSENG